MADMAPVAVYLELGRRRVFACALDWPGWCRSGRDELAALQAFAAAAPRYAPVAQRAGLAPPAVRVEVVERVPGTMTTDFGAPGEVPAADREPLRAVERERLARLVAASWQEFDRVAAGAPAELRKGPRGGGRDRDAILAHVLGAEAEYGRRIGVRMRPPDPADPGSIEALRAAILRALCVVPEEDLKWPPRYAARRIAWHALDHAWEIEDRTPA